MELMHQELKDEIYSFSPPPMKKSETRNSISSVDSDVSLSFDRRSSKSEEADLSDYDESKFSNKININQISDADFIDGIISKELKIKRPKVPFEISKAEKIIDNLVTLNDELIDKICAQVEFYFSDENIIKDAFLLKHIKRNKEGYVSLKLISSFKRVKHLSRDWRVIGTALAKSKKLEVNLQGTKLRRVDPLPSFDQMVSSKTILVANLSIEKLTVESVAAIFKTCGEIALIRVFKSGHPVPFEIRHAISKRLDLASLKECAMVEFTDSVSAQIATQMTLDNAHIIELYKMGDKKKKNQSTKKNMISKEKLNKIIREDRNSLFNYPNGSNFENSKRHKKSIQAYPIYHIHTDYPFQVNKPDLDTWLSRKLSSCSISSPENTFIFRRLSSDSSSNSESSRRYSTCSSDSEAGFFQANLNNFYQYENHRYSSCPSTGSSLEYGENYYVTDHRGSFDYEPFLRRLSTCSRDSGYDMNIRRVSLCSSNSEQNGSYRSRSNSSITMMHLPENVMRMPLGPDGTRGFFCRSAKMSMPIKPIS